MSDHQRSRVIMLGTGDFALPTFLRLMDSSSYNVIALITQPDRPQGRKQELIPSRIKEAALARSIPVYQPEIINAPEPAAWMAGRQPDFLVTAAYGQILSPEILSIPKQGAINLHGSILPAYRGAAPVARAIENSETTAGVTVIRMSPRVDAGGMIKFAETPVDPDETAGELEDRLAILGAPLIETVLGEIERGEAVVLPQERAKVTKAPKLRKDDGIIDWSKTGRAIHDKVRAMNPWPLATTYWESKSNETASKPPQRLIVHRTKPLGLETNEPPGTVIQASGNGIAVATGERGALAILTLQLVGKKPLAAAEFLRGQAIRVGDRLGDVPTPVS